MRRSIRYFFILTTLAYFAGVAWLFARDFFPAPAKPIPKPPIVKEEKSFIPARLRIPVIHVDAEMQTVDLTPTGAIGIPTNYTDVAWFTGSPRPGNAGNAIMVGHRDTRLFAPGVFRRLPTLQIGDDVYVDGADGNRLHFRVVAHKMYREDTDRLAEIVGPTDRTRLNLITCEGTWNQSVRRYDQRLVVFTELVM